MPWLEGGVAGVGGASAPELVVEGLALEQEDVTTHDHPMEENLAVGKAKSSNCAISTGV